MCVLYYTQTHPDYAFILASNRDEFLHRATAAASFDPTTHVLAGRDLEKGGSWLAVQAGADGGLKGSSITNVTEQLVPAPEGTTWKSRGELVAAFFDDDRPMLEHADAVEQDKQLYPAFNLLLFTISPEGAVELAYVSNRQDQSSHVLDKADSWAGISNAPLNAQEGWTKVPEGCAALQSSIGRLSDMKNEDELAARAFEILSSSSSPVTSRESLRRTIHVPPLVIDPSRPLSFPSHPPSSSQPQAEQPAPVDVTDAEALGVYGTRTQTVLAVKRVGDQGLKVSFWERDAWKLVDTPGAAGKQVVWSGEVRKFGILA